MENIQACLSLLYLSTILPQAPTLYVTKDSVKTVLK